MGAPRAEATVEEPRVPSRRKEPLKGFLEGHLGRGEGACLALPTCFGASVGGGESQGCPAGETPYSSPARVSQLQGHRGDVKYGRIHGLLSTASARRTTT